MSRLCIASLYGPRVSLHAATSMMAPALRQPGQFACKWCLFKQWCDFIQLARFRKRFLLKMASLEAASRVVVGLRPGLPPFAGADPVTPSQIEPGADLRGRFSRSRTTLFRLGRDDGWWLSEPPCAQPAHSLSVMAPGIPGEEDDFRGLRCVFHKHQLKGAGHESSFDQR